MRIQNICLTFCALFLFVASCKKDGEPCDGVKSANADFNFEAKFMGNYYPLTRAYSYSLQLIRLTLIDPSCDSVWWKVEADTHIYRNKSELISFNSFGTHQVQCIVFNKRSISCNFGSGYDTITKTIELLPPLQSPARGKYQGYYSNDPNKTLKTIRIDSGDHYPHLLYLLDFPDSSCIYSKVYGPWQRFELYDLFISDYQSSYINSTGGLYWDLTCDCLDAKYDDLDSESQKAKISWSDNYKRITIRYWQRESLDIKNTNFQEVTFIGERIP